MSDQGAFSKCVRLVIIRIYVVTWCQSPIPLRYTASLIMYSSPSLDIPINFIDVLFMLSFSIPCYWVHKGKHLLTLLCHLTFPSSAPADHFIFFHTAFCISMNKKKKLYTTRRASFPTPCYHSNAISPISGPCCLSTIESTRSR